MEASRVAVIAGTVLVTPQARRTAVMDHRMDIRRPAKTRVLCPRRRITTLRPRRAQMPPL